MTDQVNQTAVVFDIDGTVADCRHRQHHLTSAVPDWDAFFTRSDIDGPLAAGVALARQHAAEGHLMWLTGRPERFRANTIAWLEAHGLPTADLHMRPNEDMRPVATFKAERLAQIAAEWEILLVVDDDNTVVTALREAGWPVQQAQWMST